MNIPYIDIHTHKRTGTKIEIVSIVVDATLLAEKPSLPELPHSLGFHPWQVAKSNADSLALIDSPLLACKFRSAWAIGEIGLDFSIDTARIQQEEIFIAQLKLAQTINKPVILHCVKAFNETMNILRCYMPPATIFHSFIGSSAQALQALAQGHYLSFGERSLASAKTVEALKVCPLSQMFLETDASVTTIEKIYLQAADLLAIPLADLKQQLFENYKKVFGCDRSDQGDLDNRGNRDRLDELGELGD